MKKNNFINKFLILQLPYAVTSLMPILSLPIFTKFLSTEDYGILALASVYGILFGGLSNLGLTVAFERNFFQLTKKINQINLMWSCLILSMLILGFFSSITFFFHNAITNLFFNTNFEGKILFYALLFAGLKNSIQFFYVFMINNKLVTTFAFISMIETIIVTTCSIIFVSKFKLGVSGYISGQVTGVSLILIFLSILYILKNGFSINILLLKNALIFGLPLTPRVFFNSLSSQFDKYLLGYFNSLGVTGLLNIAQKISYSSNNFLSSLQNLYGPDLYDLYHKKKYCDFKNGSNNLLYPYFNFYILICLSIGMFSEELLLILTTEGFHKAYPIIIPLVMFYVVNFFGTTKQLLIANKSYLISKLSMITLVINIIITLPVIYKFGLYGAAWGAFFSGIISSYLNFYYSQKFLKIDFSLKFLRNLLFVLLLLLVSFILYETNINYVLRLSYKILSVISILILTRTYIYLKSLSNIIFRNDN